MTVFLATILREEKWRIISTCFPSRRMRAANDVRKTCFVPEVVDGGKSARSDIRQSNCSLPRSDHRNTRRRAAQCGWGLALRARAQSPAWQVDPWTATPITAPTLYMARPCARISSFPRRAQMAQLCGGSVAACASTGRARSEQRVLLIIHEP